MTNELEPCPFCGGEVEHEFKTNEIGEPYGDGLYVCQNAECGASLKFPQDWSLSMSRKDESERRYNTRYKRTCHDVTPLLSGGLPFPDTFTCSECGAKEQGVVLDEGMYCYSCGAMFDGRHIPAELR